MATLAQLYNEEENWAASIAAVLAAGGTSVPTANILPSQSVSYFTTPRIEVDVEEAGNASEHLSFANGEWYYSHRFIMLRIDIVTNRTAETAQDHGSIRGRVRYLMAREAQTLTAPAVTWYETLDVQDMGSAVGVRDSEVNREDVTTLRYRIEYGIPTTVVPTV